MKKLDSSLSKKKPIHVRNLNINVEEDVKEFFIYRPFFTFVFMDLDDCSAASQTILHEASRLRLLNATRNFILFTQNYSHSIEMMKNVSLNVNSKILLVAIETKKGQEKANFFQIYGIPTSKLVVKHVGRYEHKVLQISQKAFIAADLGGIKLSVCTYVSTLLASALQLYLHFVSVNLSKKFCQISNTLNDCF